MKKFTQFMEKYFMPIAGKIGSQKHLVAIRDSFIAIMPITMVGSVAVLLNVFLRDLPTEWGMDGFVKMMQPVIDINGAVWFGSIAILALCFVFALGYNIAKAYDVNPIAGGVIAFAALFVCMNQNAVLDVVIPGLTSKADMNALVDLGVDKSLLSVADGTVALNSTNWGFVNINLCGSAGLFTALIVGLFSSMVYVKLMIKKVTFKLPDSVPPAVSNAFAAIIPGVVAIYLVAIISQIIHSTTGMYINDLVLKFIQEPLLGLSQGFFAVILVTFLSQLLWFFGLHGSNVLAPVMDGVYLTALTSNAEHYEKTKSIADMPYDWTRGSFDAYCNLGGSGCTLALVIAIFLFSKRDDNKTIAKLSAPMGAFNINEPIIFGLPIVLNPIYLIPWLIVPPILACVAYGATAAGFVPPVYVTVPWVMPVGIYAFLSTGGSIAAAILAFVNLAIATVLYAPFVILANRNEANEKASEEQNNVDEKNVKAEVVEETIVENKNDDQDDEWSF